MAPLDSLLRKFSPLAMAIVRSLADLSLEETAASAAAAPATEKGGGEGEEKEEKEEKEGKEWEEEATADDDANAAKATSTGDPIQSPAAKKMEPALDEKQRWKYIDQILSTPSAYLPEADAGSIQEAMAVFASMKVLVIGAGGLGCEILKNLAMSKFRDIEVIDMDTIDISNLNRQFLFRRADVGKYKADVAAAFVMRRVPGVRITPHCCRIQDYDADFYSRFQLVVCGLDSIEARRWINAMLVSIVDENPDSIVPMIDGGTEGFKGQARVIIPGMTSCIECQLDMYVPRAAVPLCTIASIPRQPEHCIEWAHLIAWDKEQPFPALDRDEPEHVTWIYERAAERAREYGIEGVTYARTQGVIKNIIPAIASTNAIIAGACCNEALKIASGAAPALGVGLDGAPSYMMYSGNDSIYTYTFAPERREDCPVCGRRAKALDAASTDTLGAVLESLAVRPEAQLRHPSMRAEGKTLYMRSPPGLEEQTRPNLKRTLADLGLEHGQEVVVTDPAFPVQFKFLLRFPKAAAPSHK